MRPTRRALLALAGANAAPARAASAPFEAWIGPALTAARVPGVSIAAAALGRPVTVAAFGAAREGVAATPQTLFQGASVSKAVAAAVAVRCVAAGLLPFDDDIAPYLGGFALRTPEGGPAPGPVTLRMLLAHTAGATVPGFPGTPQGAALPTLRQVLEGAWPATTPPVRIAGTPGARFAYAGGGTCLVQLAIETAFGGEPFASVAARLVLRPLGMDASVFAPDPPPALLDRAAHARWLDGRPIPGGWHRYVEVAAAGLWTTPADLMRFGLGLQSAMAGETDALLPRDLALAMAEPPRPGLPHGAGLLAPIDRLAQPGEGWFGHPGVNAGFRARFVASRTGGRVQVIMTNGSDYSDAAWDLFDAVGARLGPDGALG